MALTGARAPVSRPCARSRRRAVAAFVAHTAPAATGVYDDALERRPRGRGADVAGFADGALDALRKLLVPALRLRPPAGVCTDEAEDLTQAFFERVLEKDYLSNVVGPEKGKFRTFLLVCLKRFLVNEWDREGPQARRRPGAPADRAVGAERSRRPLRPRTGP